jgi:hypothetical protein
MNIGELLLVIIGLPFILLLAWLGDSKRDNLDWSDDEEE